MYVMRVFQIQVFRSKSQSYKQYLSIKINSGFEKSEPDSEEYKAYLLFEKLLEIKSNLDPYLKEW